MEPNIGLQKEYTAEIAARLRELLATEIALYLTARNAHWNIVDSNFSGLHAFFQDQYEIVDDYFDDVAERIRAYGYHVTASSQVVSSRSMMVDG